MGFHVLYIDPKLIVELCLADPGRVNQAREAIAFESFGHKSHRGAE